MEYIEVKLNSAISEADAKSILKNFENNSNGLWQARNGGIYDKESDEKIFGFTAINNGYLTGFESSLSGNDLVYYTQSLDSNNRDKLFDVIKFTNLLTQDLSQNIEQSTAALRSLASVEKKYGNISADDGITLISCDNNISFFQEPIGYSDTDFEYPILASYNTNENSIICAVRNDYSSSSVIIRFTDDNISKTLEGFDELIYSIANKESSLDIHVAINGELEAHYAVLEKISSLPTGSIKHYTDYKSGSLAICTLSGAVFTNLENSEPDLSLIMAKDGITLSEQKFIDDISNIVGNKNLQSSDEWRDVMNILRQDGDQLKNIAFKQEVAEFVISNSNIDLEKLNNVIER